MDSGIELNEQDPSSDVVHRTPIHSKKSENDDEAEILDQDQQQQVIDSLTKDYEHMVRSQRYSFIVLTLIVSFACIFAAYSTGKYQILLPASASYLSLILAEFLLHSSKKLSKVPPVPKESANDKKEAKNDSTAEPVNNKTNNLWIWIVPFVIECYSIFSSYKYGVQDESIKRTPIIIIHAGYFILAAFLYSLQHFSQTFPDEIKNLQKLKYGSKLA